MDSDQKATVEMMKDSYGLDHVLLREPRGASARVYLFGGQVTSWKNERQEELLFMSSKALFKPPKAIRGGIPICFPQFGNSGSLEQHGFARNKFWTIDNNPPPLPANDYHNKAIVDLILKSNDDDLKSWPYCFELRLRVALAPGGDLTLISRIRNIDSNEVRIEGLETLDYLDNLQDKERFTEQSDAITFESEVDRVYLSTPTKIAILDHEKKRTFVLRKDGLPDAVVWNPWEKKAKAIVDFGDDEYKHMLCVDGAAIEKPITLRPGEEWKGRIELSAVASSYCSGQLDPQRVLEG
ncbi:putative glucose-6-phosphate 1-epimerase isoform X2 [Cryptomeria japonica]|uniref:putative glucose-6-phosphate 1-epimerase isoform X2 n=1 Tax=Cryptomeria japonica TaxID=3369 RepID=UPI0027DA37CE|nr:putative glucose-6-phosphate 1-epimerase isoform X2 [Cryptomeria japonica]